MGLVSQNALSRKQSSDNNEANLNQDNVGEAGDAYADLKSQRRKQKREAFAKKKEHKVASEMQEMKKLEGILFGPLHSSVGFGKEAAEDIGVDMNEDEEQITKINIARTNKLRKLRRKGEILVSGANYVARLRSQHVKLNPRTKWAELRDGSDDESNEENESIRAQGHGANGNNILLSSKDAVVRSTTKLLPRFLEFSILIDGNAEVPLNGPITSVEFHKNAQLLLTAGLDKKLIFFHINGKRNTQYKAIFLWSVPFLKLVQFIFHLCISLLS
ncbi:U3 small nucleolar RNA-associated protein [Nymphaea thermarum]|nr:U3 small nucleolar RNA-associated protein [Nymphaea thermarum]